MRKLDLVVDNYGRKAILIRKRDRPNQAWLGIQNDKRMQNLNSEWWTAFPLTGGAVCVPIELCSYLRKATEKDLALAYENANPFAQDVLGELSK